MRAISTQHIVLALLSFVTGIVLAEPSIEPDLHVPATGSDSWSGTLPALNADASDIAGVATAEELAISRPSMIGSSGESIGKQSSVFLRQ